jgi:hypothetical protein
MSKFGVEKEEAQKPWKEKLKKETQHTAFKSTARCPVSLRQAISRHKITPSYIV